LGLFGESQSVTKHFECLEFGFFGWHPLFLQKKTFRKSTFLGVKLLLEDGGTPSTFLMRCGHLEMDISTVSFAEHTQYSNKIAIDLSS